MTSRVMQPGFRIRVAEDGDDDAIARLASESADGGTVAFSFKYHVPPRLALPPGFDLSAAVVAELPGEEELAGSARLRVGTLRLNGTLRPVALLSSLVVHPRARRRGIAAALTRRRIELAEELAGDDVTIFANIQRGNAASTANAGAWATSTIGPVRVAPLPMRTKPPRGSRWDIQAVSEADLDVVAARLEAHASPRQFSRRWDGSALAAWLADTPVTERVNHYLVARDAGRIVAGAGVRDDWRLESMQVVRMAPAIKVANVALQVVPKDGIMRNLMVDKIWHDAGAEDAMRALVQHIRWAWRDRATSMLLELDARSPELRLIGARPWSPASSYDIAVRSPIELDPERLIDPVL